MHHLAPTRRRRRNRQILRLQGKRGVERRDQHRRIADTLGQPLRRPLDLRLSREEDEDAAVRLGERALDRPDGLVLDAAARLAAKVAGVDRPGAAVALDDGRVVQQARDPRPVQGRGHDREAKLRTQDGLAVAGEGEAEVGIQAALVKLVEQDAGDAVERRIVQDHAGEDAFGDHLDAGPGRDAALQAHAEADGLADRLPEGLGHAGRGRARGQPARLEQDELAARGPRFVKQRQRRDGRLARSRRRHDHGRRPRRERGPDRRQRLLDRQHGPRFAARASPARDLNSERASLIWNRPACEEPLLSAAEAEALPIRAVIAPVTPLQQNCTIVWCAKTKKAAVIDPGGEVERLLGAIRSQGLEVEKIWVTHGHMDHAGGTAALKDATGAPIEGPHPDDQFWIDRIAESGQRYGMAGARGFVPDRWLGDGDVVTLGETEFEVRHTPGHTPGHVIFFHRAARFAQVGDVLFQGSIGRTDFPRGDYGQLIESITTKLWPLGDDVAFVPGHGPMSTFGQERRTNPFVADEILAETRG